LQRIKKILDGLNSKKNQQQQLELLQVSIDRIKANSSVVALCPTPTGSNWLGINRATHALFPTAVLELPQHFSNSLLNEQSLKRLADTISRSKFDHIVWSGFPPYFEILAGLIREQTTAKQSCIFHGTLSELGREGHAPALLPFQLASGRMLDRIGVIRQDLAQPLSKLFQVPCFELRNICSLPDTTKVSPFTDGKRHLGVFGGSTFNKNLHNQVVAALLVEDSMVHVSDSSPFAYLNCDHQIIAHGNTLSHAEYVGLLGAMDINLYLSFSESFGQVVLESLAMGVPCLSSTTSNVLDGNAYLQQHLQVAALDSPTVIASSIMAALNNRVAISEEGLAFVKKSNAKAEKLLNVFLEA